MDFIYWNESCLKNLVARISNLMKVDKATGKREKLQYAKVLIEVKVDQEFSGQLNFINEKGTKIVFDVISMNGSQSSVMCANN